MLRSFANGARPDRSETVKMGEGESLSAYTNVLETAYTVNVTVHVIAVAIPVTTVHAPDIWLLGGPDLHFGRGQAALVIQQGDRFVLTLDLPNVFHESLSPFLHLGCAQRRPIGP
jgi:hypothetical protein